MSLSTRCLSPQEQQAALLTARRRLDEVLADPGEPDVVIEVRYRGTVKALGQDTVVLTDVSGRQFLFSRSAVFGVERQHPVHWPPRYGELWHQAREPYAGRVSWVCGYGDEEDGSWVLYPNDECERPVSETAFRAMTDGDRDAFQYGMQLAYSQERGIAAAKPAG